jgi:CarboxypepD_reg-like domain
MQKYRIVCSLLLLFTFTYYYMFIKRFLLLLLVVFSVTSKAQLAQTVIEINGVVMTADSLRYLPYVTIEVVNKGIGTLSSSSGVFSFVAERGDTITFSCVGFKEKKYVLPTDFTEVRYSMVQLMVQDTFFLPETFVRPGPKREDFDYAFRNYQIPDDKFEIARKNTDANSLRMLAYSLPKDSREYQAAYQKIQNYNYGWTGLRPAQNIFSPFAWQEFIKSWKRGDYKRKKK